MEARISSGTPIEQDSPILGIPTIEESILTDH